MDTINTFLKQYNEVFDAGGAVKLCGRDTCKKLMLNASKIKPGIDYGNMDSGFMNIEAIKELYNSLETN